MNVRFTASLLLLIWIAAPVRGVEPVSKWGPYRNDALKFELKMPPDWSVLPTEKAVGFTGPGSPSERGALGIVRGSEQGVTIEDEAHKQFEAEGSPADWVQTHARFGGWRSLKIIGSPKQAPSMKRVEYYIESPAGGYYLVQCIGPRDQWSVFGPLFATMIQSFQFLP